VTGDPGRNGFLLNRGRGGETVAGDTLLQVGMQGGENRTGCRLSLSLCHDCVGCSFSDAVLISSASVFGVFGNGFCVVLVVCHGAFFSIVGSGSAVIAVAGVSIVFDVVLSGFVIMLRSGFSMLGNGHCSFFGVVFFFVVLIQFRIVIVTFFTGSGGATKMSRHEISISFSVETGSKPIMPAERRGLVNPPEKNRPSIQMGHREITYRSETATIIT